MTTPMQKSGDSIASLLFLGLFFFSTAASGCEPPTTVKEVGPEEVRAFFKGSEMEVLTFLGYSGAEYEDKAAMLGEAARVLERLDPGKTIVNIGATDAGIGAVYEVAKRKGFRTSGLVSILARQENVPLSACVDTVFYIRDKAWGGFLPGTETLSPTSAALVENSDVVIAIGGGEVARDEFVAARRAGKRVRFVPADMNHRIAREKASRKGEPEPTDFRGAVASVF
jgi:hypothetical protein